MTKFSTECPQKLFCMLYRRKKEFDNFVTLYTNRKVAVLFTVIYEGIYVLKMQIAKGPKYRFPLHIDFQKCRENIAASLTEF